jgi:hypothetical protein
MAAPAYQAFAVHAGNPTTTATITLPTTAADDILLLAAVNAGSTAVILPMVSGNYSGGGWTGFNGAAMTASYAGFFWSRCTGDHSGQTIGIGTAVDSISAGLIVVRGAITTGSPIDTNTSSVTRTANGVTLAGFNTTVPETLAVFMGAGDNDTTFSAQTMNGAAMAERFDVASTGGADSQAFAATIAGPTSPGATGDFVATHATALSTRYTAFAIKPPPAVLLPAALTHSRAFFNATVSPQLLPGALTHSRAIPAPTVSVGSSASPAHLTHTRVIQSPTVSPQVLPGLLTHTRAIFAPTSSSFTTVGPLDHLTHNRDIFAPSIPALGAGVGAFISQRNSKYAVRPIIP